MQEVRSPWFSLLILDSIATSSCKQIFREKETCEQKNANSGFCQLKCIYRLAFYNTEHKSKNREMWSNAGESTSAIIVKIRERDLRVVI